ncbi:hypothetical protein LUD23_30165, partial [Klebsiella pneumoniae]|nr:hypothetical protein [Klebsiella pneumoniae]
MLIIGLAVGILGAKLAIAIAFGVVAGLLIALVRMLRLPVIDQLLVVYISLARATPLV